MLEPGYPKDVTLTCTSRRLGKKSNRSSTSRTGWQEDVKDSVSGDVPYANRVPTVLSLVGGRADGCVDRWVHHIRRNGEDCNWDSALGTNL